MRKIDLSYRNIIKKVDHPRCYNLNKRIGHFGSAYTAVVMQKHNAYRYGIAKEASPISEFVFYTSCCESLFWGDRNG